MKNIDTIMAELAQYTLLQEEAAAMGEALKKYQEAVKEQYYNVLCIEILKPAKRCKWVLS